MRKKEYTLITFESTHHAMAAEEVFEEENINFKTIPTPREVSHSCGLALLLGLEDLQRVKRIIEEKNVMVDGIFKFTKEGANSKANKVL